MEEIRSDFELKNLVVSPGQGLWLWLGVGEGQGRGFLACGMSQQGQLKLVTLAQHRKAKGEQSCRLVWQPGFVSLGFFGLPLLNSREPWPGPGSCFEPLEQHLQISHLGRGVAVGRGRCDVLQLPGQPLSGHPGRGWCQQPLLRGGLFPKETG